MMRTNRYAVRLTARGWRVFDKLTRSGIGDTHPTPEYPRRLATRLNRGE